MSKTETDRDFWETFLNLYKANECLWNKSSVHYSNKVLRDKAYKDLLGFTRAKFPRANKVFVMNKIKSFRSTFRKEYRKVKESATYASSPSQVHTPKLWYYHKLLFILECEMQNKPSSSSQLKSESFLLDTTTDSAGNEEEEEEEEEDEDDEELDAEQTNGNLKVDVSRVSSASTSRLDTSHSLKRKRSDSDPVVPVTYILDFIKENIQCLKSNKPEDQFEMAGKKLAHDLKEMHPRQKVFVEKLLSDAIFFGKLGKLSEYSDICLNTRALQG